MTILLISLILEIVSAGIVWPGKSPIENSIANRNEFSDYRFSMIGESDVPAGGFVEIIFPSQYLAGLGIDQIVEGTCTPACEIDKYTVRFFKPDAIKAKEEFSVVINQVLNPEKKGGTGNFIVRTKKGENVFDENLIFATLGVADYITPFNSAIIDLEGTAEVGQDCTYLFHLKSRYLLPAGTTYLFSIPDAFEFQDQGKDTLLIKINDRIINAKDDIKL